jgi:hypothetical protein
MLNPLKRRFSSLISTQHLHDRLFDNIRILDASMPFGGLNPAAEFEKSRIPNSILLGTVDKFTDKSSPMPIMLCDSK